jgi:hypothetical protein
MGIDCLKAAKGRERTKLGAVVVGLLAARCPLSGAAACCARRQQAPGWANREGGPRPCRTRLNAAGQLASPPWGPRATRPLPKAAIAPRKAIRWLSRRDGQVLDCTCRLVGSQQTVISWGVRGVQW